MKHLVVWPFYLNVCCKQHKLFTICAVENIILKQECRRWTTCAVYTWSIHPSKQISMYLTCNILVLRYTIAATFLITGRERWNGKKTKKFWGKYYRYNPDHGNRIYGDLYIDAQQLKLISPYAQDVMLNSLSPPCLTLSEWRRFQTTTSTKGVNWNFTLKM